MVGHRYDGFSLGGTEAASAVIIKVIPVCPDPVDTAYIALVLDGTGTQQCVPGLPPLFGPVGYINQQVVGIIHVPAPHGETQIVADEQAEVPSSVREYRLSPGVK